MKDMSYNHIVEQDTHDYNSCSFNWDCENCYRNLCLRMVAVADFPSIFGEFKLLAFTNNKDGKDHIAIVKGDVNDREGVIMRLHSSCVTGDALGSMRCDCGPQLMASLLIIEREGLGVLLYMQQEGRGIGLTNKIKAYMLQDNGLDTYDANIHLGFEPDERDYEISAAMLQKMGVKSIRLLSNNPEKLEQLGSFGVKINERLPLEIPANIYNLDYLKTKKNRFKHILRLE